MNLTHLFRFTPDPERATRSWRDQLGLEVTFTREGECTFLRLGDVSIALYPGTNGFPVVDVADLDEVVATLREGGVDLGPIGEVPFGRAATITGQVAGREPSGSARFPASDPDGQPIELHEPRFDPVEVVRAMWTAMEARDWDGVAARVDAALRVEWPQSSEIFDRDRWLLVNRRYPGDWHVRIERIVRADPVVSEVAVTLDGRVDRAVSFCTVRDGRIVHLRELWSEPSDVPAWRRELLAF